MLKEADLQRFYTVEEVAALIHIKVARVRDLVRAGTIPATRIGGQSPWLIDRKRLDAQLAANAIPAALDGRGRRKVATAPARRRATRKAVNR